MVDILNVAYLSIFSHVRCTLNNINQLLNIKIDKHRNKFYFGQRVTI